MSPHRVTHRPIPAHALLEHPGQHGDIAVDIVHHADLGLGVMFAVQPTGVLYQRTLPRDGHREKECVESGIVKSFAYELARGQYEPLLGVRNACELFDSSAPFLGLHASL